MKVVLVSTASVQVTSCRAIPSIAPTVMAVLPVSMIAVLAVRLTFVLATLAPSSVTDQYLLASIPTS